MWDRVNVSFFLNMLLVNLILYREWDKSGGVVGLGGMGDVNETHRGNSGCVIIYKPGNF